MIDQLQQLHDLSGYSPPEGLDAAGQELSTRVLLALAEHGPASSSDLRDVVELVADEETRRLGPTVASLSRSGRIAPDSDDDPWSITSDGRKHLDDTLPG